MAPVLYNGTLLPWAIRSFYRIRVGFKGGEPHSNVLLVASAIKDEVSNQCQQNQSRVQSALPDCPQSLPHVRHFPLLFFFFPSFLLRTLRSYVCW